MAGYGNGYWSYAGGYPAWVGYGQPNYAGPHNRQNTFITWDAAGYPVAYQAGRAAFQTYGGIGYENGCYYPWPILSGGGCGSSCGGCGGCDECCG